MQGNERLVDEAYVANGVDSLHDNQIIYLRWVSIGWSWTDGGFPYKISDPGVVRFVEAKIRVNLRGGLGLSGAAAEPGLLPHLHDEDTEEHHIEEDAEEQRCESVEGDCQQCHYTRR